MFDIINGIIRGLFEWLYELFLDLIAYSANALLGVMSTDLTYFEETVPAIRGMWQVFLAVGWALLMGNLIFQAMKSMFSGLGFEGESPVTLFARTAIFSFLLLVSRQISEIGLSISARVINLLGIPDNVELQTPGIGHFNAGGATWLLVIIIGVILGIQLIKLFFEIGERYVIVCILTFMSPLAFAMGGSKSTKEIFTGYIRMYASMLLMMVMNVVFLTLILSALATMPSGIMVLPWCVLVVALARVARKIDNLISRIGLNPAITGDPLGRSGMATFMAARMVMNSVSKAKAGAKSGGGKVSSSNRSSSSSFSGGAHSRNSSTIGAPNVGGVNTKTGGSNQTQNAGSNTAIQQNAGANQSSGQNQNNRFGGSHSGSNVQQAQSTRSGSTVGSSSVSSGRFSQNNGTGGVANNMRIGSGAGVNTNRFGAAGATGTKSKSQSKSAPANTRGSQSKGAKVGASSSGKKMPGVNPNATKNTKKSDLGNVKRSGTHNTAKAPQMKANTAKTPGVKSAAIKQSTNAFGKNPGRMGNVGRGVVSPDAAKKQEQSSTIQEPPSVSDAGGDVNE